MWLNLSDDQEVNTLMESAVESVASHKFLVLGYQIASRLGAAKPQGSTQAKTQSSAAFQVIYSS